MRQRPLTFKTASLGLAVLLALVLAACQSDGAYVDLRQQSLSMTFLHTSDTHSKVLPFRYEPSATDTGTLGIQTCSPPASDPKACDSFTYGGAARASWVIERERARAARSAYIDSGDFFQGAPIFNLFRGEAEVRALSAMNVDVEITGNHEFDNGAAILTDLLYNYASFQVLNANYMFKAPTEPGSTLLGERVDPLTVRYYDGLKVGYIGLGNIVAMTSIGRADNKLGFRAIDSIESLNKYVPMIRDQVDLVVVVSHLGVAGDMEIAEQVPGIDIIFGGHDHVVIMPPAEVKSKYDDRNVLVVHSGVNFKVVGRLDVVVRDKHVVSHSYQVFPIDSRRDSKGNLEIGENPKVANVLYDYEFELNRAQDLTRVIGKAKESIPRNMDDGGDSPLGNLVSDAMRLRDRVGASFAMTNSLGIRADFDAGDITVGKLYEVFPFENTLVTMYLSGPELKKLFDYSAARTAEYGCKTQIQISGAYVELDCSRGRARTLRIGDAEKSTTIIENYTLVAPNAFFLMATNDYIAAGGSGFYMLEQNTTKQDTALSLRDVVMDYIENKKELSAGNDERIKLIQ